jgi:hypothetical protein
MKKFAIILFILFLTNITLKSEITEDYLSELKNSEVVVRLINGDIFTCTIKDFEYENGIMNSISVQTQIGKTKIYIKELVEILPTNKYNKNSHRIYLLPTAEPIGSNHFIGNFELLMLYGGFGISDIVSVTAGRSIIPSIRSDEQISLINAKVSFYRQYWESMEGHMTLALGYNYLLLNSFNKISHIYGAATFVGAKSIFTASIYSKIGSNDYYEVNFKDNYFAFPFEDGSFGIALGIDTKFSAMKDVHFISELWNSNITKPTNTGVLLGFRIGGTKLSADFGLAVFTSPLFLPFTSFVWTPF